MFVMIITAHTVAAMISLYEHEICVAHNCTEAGHQQRAHVRRTLTQRQASSGLLFRNLEKITPIWIYAA